MADLSKFSTQDLALLASIPYRVGVWISNVDDNAKSNIDDRQERKALEAKISKMASHGKPSSFTTAIMKLVEKNRAAWTKWDAISDEEQILGDTQKALDICKGKISDKDLKQYKHMIWQMGLVVAQAYGEHIDPDNEMHFDRVFLWIGSVLGGAKMGQTPENMSKQEKIALAKLHAILKE